MVSAVNSEVSLSADAEMNGSRYREETDPITSGIRRSLHSYGSASTSLANSSVAESRPACTIRHTIQPGETLQGIALRYGCTTQDLRRVNRLFANDNIHLRPWLDVPVDSNKANANGEPDSCTHSSLDSRDSTETESDSSKGRRFKAGCVDEAKIDTSSSQGFEPNDSSRLSKSHSDYTTMSSSSSGSASAQLFVGQDPTNAAASSSNQFFEKYDQVLAGIKSNVSRFESSTDYNYSPSSSIGVESQRSSTLVYRPISEAERRKSNGSALGLQRPTVVPNGTQNGVTAFSNTIYNGSNDDDDEDDFYSI